MTIAAFLSGKPRTMWRGEGDPAVRRAQTQQQILANPFS